MTTTNTTTTNTTPTTPPFSLGQRLREALGIDLQEVAGTTVSGEIPVAATAINRLIAARLSTSEGPVTSAVIEPHEGGRLTVQVRLRMRLVPPLTIDARIVEQPDLPARPVLGIRWALPSLGALAAFVGPAVTLFAKSLPRGLRLEGDWLGVDVVELMRARGLDDLVQYLHSLQIVTQEGKVVVQFQLRG